ncbi:hypothetical protein REPUB_Repub06bG0156500 [Reevesia pubescens]
MQSQSVVNVKQLHRSGYHFQPPMNWINGPMYYNGIYHLFYQYNPKGAVWGNIVWVHSVSKDMINWEALEHTIYPSEPFDINGCWSGSATILPDNKPIIFYTGIDPQQNQVQNYAIPANLSDPYLRKWTKPADNPMAVADETMNKTAFRDPTTAWKIDGHWRMLVGMWECADFFLVSLVGETGLHPSAYGPNVKHVFKVSLDITRFEYYTIGSYFPNRDKYLVDKDLVDGWGGLRFDYGNFYASKTFFDPAKNRRILWGWANESDTPQDDVNKGWAGIQADVDVTFSIPNLDKAEPFDPSWTNAQDLCSQKSSIVQGGVGPFGLLTLASEKLEEYTLVFFRVFKGQDKHVVLLCSDASRLITQLWRVLRLGEKHASHREFIQR